MLITTTAECGCLQFEANFRGKEEFGVTYDEICGKAYIMANTAQDIVLEVNCFKLKEVKNPPELLVELYVDGILRNVVKPRTGRGMIDNQFAEVKIDRGVVLTANGVGILKNFRFIDLDLDDAVLNSRIVKEAGAIELRIIKAGMFFNEEDDIEFELPAAFNDRGAVSLFCGEVNNTVGIRFDNGDHSVCDTKEIRLQSSIDLMAIRAAEMLGETLAIFSFHYACDAILHHLGVIPQDHKNYNKELASARDEVRTRLDPKISRPLIEKAVFDSDYALCANIGKSDCSTDELGNVLDSELTVGQLKRKRSAVSVHRPAKRGRGAPLETPQKKTNGTYAPLTPPITPENERMAIDEKT